MWECLEGVSMYVAGGISRHVSSYLFAEWERWRMRVWPWSALPPERRAAGAMSSVCRLSSWWLSYIQSCVFVVGVRLNIGRRSSTPKPFSWHSLPRRSWQSASNDWYSQSSLRRRSIGRNTQPTCRSLHNRRGLWPASSKLSANAAPSASTSRLAPTPPPLRLSCNTHRCRLATLGLRRASVPVRPLSRTVRPHLPPFLATQC